MSTARRMVETYGEKLIEHLSFAEWQRIVLASIADDDSLAAPADAHDATTVRPAALASDAPTLRPAAA